MCLSSLAGYGGDQSVLARTGAVAEISRSGDGDDHNKGREVRGGGGWPCVAESAFVCACLVFFLGGGDTSPTGGKGARVFAQPRGWGCGSAAAAPFSLPLARSRLSCARPPRGCLWGCVCPPRPREHPPEPCPAMPRQGRAPGADGKPSLRGYIQQKLFLLASFLTRTVGSLIPISGLWKLSRRTRVATTWPKANLV